MVLRNILELDVSPVQSGSLKLFLSVAARIKIPGYGEEKKVYPVFERNIDVQVNPVYSTQHFLINNWKWVVSTIIGTGVFGWLLKRWRRKKKQLQEQE